MSLAPGTRLGSYQIVGPIGAGGMGEVYRARDTKLDRDVAIKVLPESFALDADRVARFTREAKTLASLNHPNIAAIYGIVQETTSGVVSEKTTPDVVFHALVMELVEGDDLSAHIARGPIPLADALPIARQIADALEAAHEQGIVHRDLKPANIKVRADGTVKVLDFGLAKAIAPDGASAAADAMNSPTLTARATQMGMILGTAAYMSPEQARGRAVDRRADIWAFGVVLYEILTGRRAFEGEDISITLASVLKEDVKWNTLPSDLPAPLRRLLRRCLEKDPKKRLSSIGDARLELDETTMAPATGETSATPTGPAPRRMSPAVIAGTAAVLVAAASIAAWQLKPAPIVDRPIIRFSVPLNEGQLLVGMNNTNIALSPDGRRLAYRADGVWLRNFDEATPRELAKDKGVGQWFSPNGEELLFGTLQGLARIPVGGGPAQLVVATQNVTGADWGDDGTIVYSDRNHIFQVAATGGTPQELLKISDGAVRWPQLLPGGAGVLYTKVDAKGVSTQVVPLTGGDPRTVLTGGAAARYVSTGHLLYAAERLMAVPFDLGTLAVAGPAVPMPETVSIANSNGFPAISFSDSGTLAYVGRDSESRLQLVWADAQGKVAPALTVPHNYSDLALSPDGRRVALHLYEGDNDIWIADLTRAGLTRMTFTANEEETPVWSPDGKELAYAEQTQGAVRALIKKAPDGGAAAAAKTVWTTPNHFHVNDWSPDGRTILVEISRQGTLSDIFAIDVATGKDTPLLASPYVEAQARFSPDGKWLAYASDESGASEVYVQPYPALNARVPVSTGGGVEPVWSRDGRKLFFRSKDNIMTADVTKTSPLEFGTPRVLFPDRFVRTQGTIHTHYAVAADGRLLLIDSIDGSSRLREEINIVLNWGETLKRLAPRKK